VDIFQSVMVLEVRYVLPAQVAQILQLHPFNVSLEHFLLQGKQHVAHVSLELSQPQEQLPAHPVPLESIL